jgi:hypothetical protein
MVITAPQDIHDRILVDRHRNVGTSGSTIAIIDTPLRLQLVALGAQQVSVYQLYAPSVWSLTEHEGQKVSPLVFVLWGTTQKLLPSVLPSRVLGEIDTPPFQQQDFRHETLRAFASRARAILESEGIELKGIKIRDWQSVEDPSFRQTVLDLRVAAKADVAVRVWDELSEELDIFLQSQPELIRTFLQDTLSISVDWDSDGNV